MAAEKILILNDLKTHIENLNNILIKKEQALKNQHFETAALYRDEEKALDIIIKETLIKANNLLI